MNSSASIPLKGIIPPLVTPLSDRDTLDVGSLERVIEHVIAGGVSGIFLLGTTGEGPSISVRLRRELIATACRLVRDRVPVMVGVTDTSYIESLDLASHADESGASSIVVAPPPYFPISQAELAAYMTTLAQESPLPILLYNMPSHCKVSFAVETVSQLMNVPRITGIKDSSAQMLYFQQLVQLGEHRPDFGIYMGPEELMAEGVMQGGHGGVCGGLNLAPELYVGLYRAAVAGDLRIVHKLQQQVLRLSNRLYQVGPPPSGYLAGLKCALSVVGLCKDVLAPPLRPLDEASRRIITQHVADLGLCPVPK